MMVKRNVIHALYETLLTSSNFSFATLKTASTIFITDKPSTSSAGQTGPATLQDWVLCFLPSNSPPPVHHCYHNTLSPLSVSWSRAIQIVLFLFQQMPKKHLSSKPEETRNLRFTQISQRHSWGKKPSDSRPCNQHHCISVSPPVHLWLVFSKPTIWSEVLNLTSSLLEIMQKVLSSEA